MTDKHTPEPWAVSDSSPQGLIVSNADDIWRRNWCISTSDTGRNYCHALSVENARRIVACINACAGIPTESLISGSIVVKSVDGSND